MGYRKDKLLTHCLATGGKKVRFNSVGIEEDNITKTFAHLSLSSWLIEITTFTHSFKKKKKKGHRVKGIFYCQTLFRLKLKLNLQLRTPQMPDDP